MNKPRRHFADPQKVAILKRHLIDKVPVSDLCDEFDIYPRAYALKLARVSVTEEDFFQKRRD